MTGTRLTISQSCHNEQWGETQLVDIAVIFSTPPSFGTVEKGRIFVDSFLITCYNWDIKTITKVKQISKCYKFNLSQPI